MDKNHFEIGFTFEHHHYLASVSVLRSGDHTQYTVSPKDEHLLLEHAAQVFHRFPGKPLQAAFPGNKAYTEAIAKGLAHFLEKDHG